MALGDWYTRFINRNFVIKSQGRIAACEVKAGDLRGRLPRASRSFIEAYQPELFLAVNDHAYPSLSLGGTKARYIRLFELADAVKAWAEK